MSNQDSTINMEQIESQFLASLNEEQQRHLSLIAVDIANRIHKINEAQHEQIKTLQSIFNTVLTLQKGVSHDRITN